MHLVRRKSNGTVKSNRCLDIGTGEYVEKVHKKVICMDVIDNMRRVQYICN